MERTLSESREDAKIDVFGRYWNLFVSDITPGSLEVWDGERWLNVCGQVACFLPKYSISHWRVHRPLRFKSYLSDFPVEDFSLKEPLFFELDELPEFSKTEQIVDWLTQKKDKACSLEMDEFAAKLARRTRMVLNKEYLGEKNISEIALEMGVSHSNLTKTFKNNYGVTPHAYRNKLRVYDSLWLLLSQGEAISGVAHESGFGDLSRFNKQFKRFSEVAPSSFVKPKKQSSTF